VQQWCEDRTLDTRKERYTAEAKTAFGGQVWVPDDFERINIEDERKG